MQISDYKTTTYKMGKGWMLDITDYAGTYEAWIYHIHYGIKDLMFGISKLNTDYTDFLNMAVDQFGNYTDDYSHDYFQGEKYENNYIKNY